MFNKKHLKASLNKIKNSLYLGLIFVILYPEIINAAKIKNCSNCGDGTFISNNNENDNHYGPNSDDKFLPPPPPRTNSIPPPPKRQSSPPVSHVSSGNNCSRSSIDGK